MTADKDTLRVTWLGQSGFLFEASGLRIVVDPYLSDSKRKAGMPRRFPAPFTVDELFPDILCCTHDHPGHFDAKTVVMICRRYPECIVLGPGSVMQHCLWLGIAPHRIMRLHEQGEGYTCPGAGIRAVAAYHHDLHAIGLAISMAGLRIYISGDTARLADLATSVKSVLDGSPDIVMVCINGKGGNMDHHDAVGVIEELKPRIAIPMHYGLFAENTADPYPFASAVAGLGINSKILVPGRKYAFRGAPS